jgi:hypothetical protein
MSYETSVRTGSGEITIRHGSEGPRHDPYSFTEISYTQKGTTVMIHSGFECFVEYEGIRANLRTYEEVLEEFVFRSGGFTPEQLERFVQRAQSRCTKCGSKEIGSVAGFPGETLYQCCKCDNIIGGSFDRSAIE